MPRAPQSAMSNLHSYSRPQVPRTLSHRSRPSSKDSAIKRCQNNKQSQTKLSAIKQHWLTTRGPWYRSPWCRWEVMPWWRKQSCRRSWGYSRRKSTTLMCWCIRLSRYWRKRRNSANRNLRPALSKTSWSRNPMKTCSSTNASSRMTP